MTDSVATRKAQATKELAAQETAKYDALEQAVEAPDAPRPFTHEGKQARKQAYRDGRLKSQVQADARVRKTAEERQRKIDAEVEAERRRQHVADAAERRRQHAADAAAAAEAAAAEAAAEPEAETTDAAAAAEDLLEG